ncbi:lariat debranching enzyme, partial [Coemansia nantahalensis]
AIRNVTDLGCMSCPDKYKQIGGFYRYYTGERKAPVPTLFVGGNHEAGNHQRELYYGGWVAPNIYFMGNSGVVRFGGLRIGGISGIYKDFDYAKGYYERPPFRGHSRSSMHHVRAYEAFKMLQLRTPLDIVVSHDWPQYIENHGDTEELLRKKPFFRAEVARGDLGSAPNAMLLERLRPAWWVSAHLHVRFTATVQPHDTLFGGGWGGIAPYNQPGMSNEAAAAAAAAVAPGVMNADEIVLESPSEDDEPAARAPRLALNLPPPKNTATVDALLAANEADDAPSTPGHPAPAQPQPEPRAEHESASTAQDGSVADPRVPGRPTRFLALDKCLPRRQFLEIIDVDVPADAGDKDPRLEYDPEWLAILRLCHRHMPLDEAPFQPPPETAAALRACSLPLFPDACLDRELDWVRANVFAAGRVFVPSNFVPVAPVPPPGTPDSVSFGLAGRSDDRNQGRGRGGGRGRGRGRGANNGQSRQSSDVPWPGPRPDVIYPNTQTDVFCSMLGLDDQLTQRQH